MNNNNILPKNREIAVEVACDLLLNGEHKHHIEEGLTLHLTVETAFKTVANWYGMRGSGVLLAKVLESDLVVTTFGVVPQKEEHFYIVDKAANALTYRWRRRRLGNRLFLRPMRPRELVCPHIKHIKSRDILV